MRPPEPVAWDDDGTIRKWKQHRRTVAAPTTSEAVAAKFTDPDVFLLGGGVIEAEPSFRDWFLEPVEAHTLLRHEQREVVSFALVTDLDMAGARGSAIAAANTLDHG